MGEFSSIVKERGDWPNTSEHCKRKPCTGPTHRKKVWVLRSLHHGTQAWFAETRAEKSGASFSGAANGDCAECTGGWLGVGVMSEQSFGNVDRISYCLSLIDLHLILPETAGFARDHQLLLPVWRSLSKLRLLDLFFLPVCTVKGGQWCEGNWGRGWLIPELS